MAPHMVAQMEYQEDAFFRQLAFGGPRKLEVGRSYIVKERKPEKAWAAISELLDQGYEGLYITRQHPNHVERRWGPTHLRVVWLSTTLGREYVDPHNLGALTTIINDFTAKPRKTVILIDGMEYLHINNDSNRILKFVEYLNEIVVQRQCVLVMSVDERAFDSKELALLERNAVLLD